MPVKAIVTGVVTAVLGIAATLSPYGWAIEEDLGLAWLFRLRGARAVPAEVVVVTTDRESAFDLGLPQAPWKWPRSLHGELVTRLAERGASVIAFDMFFKDSGPPDEDRAFADALGAAGNVVLFEKLTNPRQLGFAAGVHLRMRPTRELAEAAAVTAPNPLPAVPFRVNQFWLLDPGSPDVETLPFVAFQIHILPTYEALVRPLTTAAPDLANDYQAKLRFSGKGQASFGKDVRDLFRKRPDLLPEVLAELERANAKNYQRHRAMLTSLLNAYETEPSRYLDFYGPPRTITTVLYSCVFDRCNDRASREIDWAGKAVFVGFSERVQSEQMDRFHTVFTSKDGVYLSGVEVTATAFANLLEDRQVTPLGGGLTLLAVAGWGLLVGGSLGAVPRSNRRGSSLSVALIYVAVAAGLGGVYLAVALLCFDQSGLWLPLVVPGAQLGLGLFGTIVWRYREEQRDRMLMRQLFGRHVSDGIAEAIWQQRDLFLREGRPPSQELVATVLFADFQGYTSISEKLEPKALILWLNSYLEVMSEMVRQHQGYVDDYAGDAIKANFYDPVKGISGQTVPEEEVARHAQHAVRCAVAMANELQRLNRGHEAAGLPIVGMRIGIYTGPVVAGCVGSAQRMKYTTVGDSVNAAARLESLDRDSIPSGAAPQPYRILIGEATARYVKDTVQVTDIGELRVKGREHPIHAFQVVAPSRDPGGL